MSIGTVFTFILSFAPFLAYVLYNQLRIKDISVELGQLKKTVEDRRIEDDDKISSLRNSVFKEIKKLNDMSSRLNKDVTRIDTALFYQISNIAELQMNNRQLSEQSSKRVDDLMENMRKIVDKLECATIRYPKHPDVQKSRQES